VAFSPDGKLLATLLWWGTQRVWDLQTGQAIRTFKGGYGPGGLVVFSPDCQRLASIAANNTVKIWDAQHDQESRTLPVPAGAFVAFSPDWQRLARATWDKNEEIVEIRDAQTGQVVLRLKGHTVPVMRLAFSPDAKRLASGGSGRRVPGAVAPLATDRAEVKVWDTQTGKELIALPVSSGFVGGLAFSPDGKLLAGTRGTSPLETDVKVWDSQTGRDLYSLKGGGFAVAFSPDGKRLASGSTVWDAQTGKKHLDLEGGGGFGPSFSPDGKRLAGAGKVWDAQTGQVLLTLKGGVVFSPDGKRLASRDGRTLKVWDAQTGQELLSLKGHTTDMGIIAFSPDGHRLAGTASDDTVKIYDATPLPEKP
jgi:WD40 repeat protein